MKSTIIPAQITTVEDRIAGSLNFTQILLLMVPVVTTSLIYAVIYPAMHITWVKVGISTICVIVCCLFSIRVHGRLVLDHMLTRIRFSIRPRIYVPMKTDTAYKTIDIPEEEIVPLQPTVTEKPVLFTIPTVNLADIVKFERYIEQNRFTIRYKSNKKGGLDVAYEPVH